MSRDAEGYKESQSFRSDVIAKFGAVPESILRRVQDRNTVDLIVDKTDVSYSGSNKKNRLSLHPHLRQTGMRCQGKGCGSGALSKFPQNVGRLLTLFYSKENDTVYDPFAGHNSRMTLVHNCHRNYIGVDVCKDFMGKNRTIRASLLASGASRLLKNECSIQLITGSSANVTQVKSDSCDFTISSPPYWDIEYYGDEPEQLGKCKTYDAFLNSIYKHIRDTFRILKAGSFVCWCVNDFTKKGAFYPYHSDTITLFRNAGFLPFAVYVIDLGSTLATAFARTIMKTKRFAKRHEYVLVFQVPSKEVI